MRTDVLAFHDFYATPLGECAAGSIGNRLVEAWGTGEGLVFAGFGYASPYLARFEEARKRVALAPASQGVVHWPHGAANLACLTPENSWPLPDASVDRLIIAHGLEEASDPRRLMREIWRVLDDSGRVIFVVSHRRGFWPMIDSTPFAAGRPYLKRQLNALLEDCMFRAVAWSSALHFPPVQSPLFLRASSSFERAGSRVWPAFSGVILVEAAKDMMTPAGARAGLGVRAIRPSMAVRPVRIDAASRLPDKAR